MLGLKSALAAPNTLFLVRRILVDRHPASARL